MRKKPKPRVIAYGPVNESHGYRNVRWVENVSQGLRCVGFADEVMRGEGFPRAIDHKGWYSRDEDFDEVYRGIVYQLPARHGLPQFVYGYADPNNDDCALICFDPVDDKKEAAKQADRFAEIWAEHERDYDRAWRAGRRYDDLEDEIKNIRIEALTIGAELRANKRAAQNAPKSCEVLRSKILALYQAIQKMRKERAELLADFGRQPGFKE